MLDAPHIRSDGPLYGGAGVAILTEVLARRTGRDPLWLTTQYVGTAQRGEELVCRAEVLAEGRLVSQVRITATVGDRLVLAGLGAAGIRRGDALSAAFGGMPEVTDPESVGAWGLGGDFDIAADYGPRLIGEFRRARSDDGKFRLWVRLNDRRHSFVSLAYVADVVPGFVVRMAGRAGAGSSLDNTMRFGPPPDCEWVLLDVVPHVVDGGFIHGSARVWSPDGVLVAVASQTARAQLLD